MATPQPPQHDQTAMLSHSHAVNPYFGTMPGAMSSMPGAMSSMPGAMSSMPGAAMMAGRWGPHGMGAAPWLQSGLTGGPVGHPPMFGGMQPGPHAPPSLRMQVVGASIEALKHLFQVMMLMARSAQEIFSVVVGCWYMYRAVKEMMQYARPPGSPSDVRAGPLPLTAAPSTPAKGAAASSSSSSRTLMWFGLFAAAAMLIEHVANQVLAKKERHRQHQMSAHHEDAALGGPRVYEVADSDLEDTSSIGSDAESESSIGVDQPIGAAWQPGRTDPIPAVAPAAVAALGQEGGMFATLPTAPPAAGDVYVAQFDFASNDPNQLSFRAGDQFTISNFDDGGWCIATGQGIDRGGIPRRAGLVPGNFFQRLASQMPRKL